MIAIILVNYNGAKDTIECIESLQELTYSAYKIIVVDNKSTDDSLNKLKEYKNYADFVLLESGENNGFSAGNNLGIKYAVKQGADYIWLLNNDTLVDPNSLSELVKGLDNSISNGIATARIYYAADKSKIWYAGGAFSDTTARTEHWHYGEEDKGTELDNAQLQDVTFASGCCMLIKKEALDKVGLLDESYFLYEEDTEYCIRIRRDGFNIVYCPKAIIYHKVSASTGKSSPISQFYSIRNKYRLIQQHFQGINKVAAYLYSTVQMINRCLKKELNWKYFFMGLRAFQRKESGRRDKLI